MQFKQPAAGAAKIFKILCLKWWYKSNLAMGVHIGKSSFAESEERTS